MANMIVLARCRVCRTKIPIGDEMENHLYSHYNYCEHGHYEEFDFGDPNWPKCKDEMYGGTE